MKIKKPILETLRGEKAEHVPIWLMRQAGRYLPEYRALRAQADGFLDLCLTPKWAAEITLQPIRRFDFDAAILFADILLIPHALGQRLEFREGEGPVLEKVDNETAVNRLSYNPQKILPVFETLSLVKGQLPKQTALIGFCGGMWTVAAYMIDGNSRSGFSSAKDWVRNKPYLLDRLIAKLIGASEDYLCRQIEAGAEIVQIFESWAGLLSGDDFDRFVIAPTFELVGRIKRKFPHIPIIGFPRECGKKYADFAGKTNIDAMGIDQGMPLAIAKAELQPLKILQGNLDPALLVKGGDDMRRAAFAILETFGPNHIFNLGHGVVPQTPPEHVAQLVDIVRNHKAA